LFENFLLIHFDTAWWCISVQVDINYACLAFFASVFSQPTALIDNSYELSQTQSCRKPNYGQLKKRGCFFPHIPTVGKQHLGDQDDPD
jgi:hypothetical protein